MSFPLGRLKNKILSLLKPFQSLRIKSSKEAYVTVEREGREESVLPSVAVSDYYSFDPNSLGKVASMSARKSHRKYF